MKLVCLSLIQTVMSNKANVKSPFENCIQPKKNLFVKLNKLENQGSEVGLLVGATKRICWGNVERGGVNTNGFFRPTNFSKLFERGMFLQNLKKIGKLLRPL